jgi:trehalose synthase-fused probable maltokinase
MLEWAEIIPGFDESNEAEIIRFIERQRWFGSKGHSITGIGLAESLIVSTRPALVLVLVEVRLGAEPPELYQMLLNVAVATAFAADRQIVTSTDEAAVTEAFDDPAFIRLISSGEESTLIGSSGEVTFSSVSNLASAATSVRRLDGEQSNSSVVVDEQLFVKLYRRIEAGVNPELEMLLFLCERGFRHVPLLAGWYGYRGKELRTTLGISQRFLPGAIDGWALGLAEIEDDAAGFLERVERLGDVVGAMHTVLAADHDDPDFAPEESTSETMSLLAATLEDRVEQLASSIPEGGAEGLRDLARAVMQLPPPGLLIRCHGDLHLGQVVWTDDDWVILDFEGEPARSLTHRRQKAHPLRDVAGILRSFSYLDAALQMQQKQASIPGWEREARSIFLAAYRNRVHDARLLPDEIGTQEQLIATFELEKVLYELEYELQHRPDWTPVPLAGIGRLLEESRG